MVKCPRHAKYELYYHLAHVPKYWRPLLTGKPKGYLEAIFAEICENNDLELVESEPMIDRVEWTRSYVIGTSGNPSRGAGERYPSESGGDEV